MHPDDLDRPDRRAEVAARHGVPLADVAAVTAPEGGTQMDTDARIAAAHERTAGFVAGIEDEQEREIRWVSDAGEGSILELDRLYEACVRDHAFWAQAAGPAADDRRAALEGLGGEVPAALVDERRLAEARRDAALAVGRAARRRLVALGADPMWPNDRRWLP